MERLADSKLGTARMWRNAAVRRLVWLLAGFTAAAVLLSWLYAAESADRLQRKWLDQQIAIIGQLSAVDPRLGEAWAGALARPESLTAEDKEKGIAIAEQYGLTPQLESRFSPVLSDYFRRTLLALGTAAVLLGIAAAAVLLRESRVQLTQIRKLAVSLEDAVKHNRPMAFRLYGEGELGLLANNVQELAIRLQETIGQLRRDKDFLKDTVADISHQLKTPLASLIIYMDLLGEGKVDPDRQEEFLATCRKELDRMEWLTLTLLKIARLEAEALTLRIEPAPFAATVQKAAAAVSRLAAERKVEVSVQPPSAEGVEQDANVPHDARWLAEAIANLIKNAVEHSPSGGTVTARWETTPVFLRLVVQDQGPGIPEKHLPHIFRKFYRAGPGGSGVGLGLPLAKSIVERHGGMLVAGSAPEGGARFSLTLPLHPLPAQHFVQSYNTVSPDTDEL